MGFRLWVNCVKQRRNPKQILGGYLILQPKYLPGLRMRFEIKDSINASSNRIDSSKLGKKKLAQETG